MGNLTDDEMEGLSEEELAALEDDDNEGAEDSPDAIDDLPDEDESEPETGDEDEPDEQDDKDDEAAEEGGQDDSAEDEESAVDQAAKEFRPEYRAEMPEDYDGQMTALDERKRELLDQFKDGEIRIDEYEEQRGEIEREVRALEKAAVKAEIAEEARKQAADQQWQFEQQVFFRDKANVQFRDDPIMNAAFNTALKDLASDAANDKRDMPWFLREAANAVRQRFGSNASSTNGKNNRPIPPNLGNVPAADINDVNNRGEFDHLQKLEGMDLENALAKMTPEQERRYLEG